MISADSPDDTVSSAYDSVRFPPISSSKPTIADNAICRGEYRILCPGAAHTASITSPATENRRPHINAGGMVCTAISIPKYVEPQNRYTSPKARITIHRLGRCGECIAFRATGTRTTYETSEGGRSILKFRERVDECTPDIPKAVTGHRS